MQIDFWATLTNPTTITIIVTVIAGIILLLLEYFVIQPLKEKRKQDPKENEGISNEKGRYLAWVNRMNNFIYSLGRWFVTNRFVKVLISKLSNISPKTIMMILTAFCAGIIFTVSITLITNTNLALLAGKLQPYRTPTLTSTSTPGPTPAPTPTLRASLDYSSETLFVVDTSYKSPQGAETDTDIVEQAQQALFEYSNKLLQDDNVGIVVFSAYHEPEYIFPFSNVKIAYREYINAVNNISNYSDSSGRAVYDAIIFSLAKFDSETDQPGKKVLILLTGGGDTGSNLTKQAVINSIKSRPDLTVIVVAIGDERRFDGISDMAKSSDVPLYYWPVNQPPSWINEFMNAYLIKE